MVSYKTNQIQERQRIIENYRLDNDIKSPNCISDKILLYIKYGLEQLRERYPDFNGTEEYEKKVYELYYKIRGEPEYTNKSPSSIASAILYIAICYIGHPAVQLDIAQIFLTTIHVVRTNYTKMIKDLKL